MCRSVSVRGWTHGVHGQLPCERVVPTVFAGPGDPPCAPQYDYDGSGRCFLTFNNPVQSFGVYVESGDWYLVSRPIEVDGEDAVVRYASWYSNGHTHRQMMYPVLGDVFEIQVREYSEFGTWLDVDSVGPFGTESMGGWYENYFYLSQVFLLEIPDSIQIRFKVSGDDEFGHVEAALDAFEVVVLGS